jgi:threonine dehydratase
MSDPQEAHIFVGVSVHDREETARIVRVLRRGGFRTLDLSDDEVAKGHMRHMVGGHSPLAKNELLYRFEFPERPGALVKFLTAMNPGWNISLFNYRNLGADYGSILVGMQVPRDEMADFRRFLARLGYPFGDETRNPAYRLFLAG